MTNPNYTHITLVVDRSGSMAGIQEEAQGAINAYLAEQKEVPGDCTLTLIQFDKKIDHVFQGNLADFTSYTLAPRGMTALNDAVGDAIDRTGTFLKKMKTKDRPGKVLVVIVTDGGENSSQDYTLAGVREMIATQEKDYSWQFVFLSSDLNASAQAQGYGISNSTTMAAGSSASYVGTVSVLSHNTSIYRGAGGQSMPTMPSKVDADGQTE